MRIFSIYLLINFPQCCPKIVKNEILGSVKGKTPEIPYLEQKSKSTIEKMALHEN